MYAWILKCNKINWINCKSIHVSTIYYKNCTTFLNSKTHKRVFYAACLHQIALEMAMKGLGWLMNSNLSLIFKKTWNQWYMSLINFNSISMHYVCVHRRSIHTVYGYRGFFVLTVVSCHANSEDDPHPPSASVSQWAMVLFFVLILR